MPPLPIDPIEIPALRQTHYNATLVDLRFCHGDLAFFRVLPDHPVRAWMPGQFATIGLGGWEARAPDTQPESLDAVHCRHLIRRAYSISAPILTPSGVVTPPYLDPVLEFYITLVRRNDGPPPALTPRLFCLKPGDRLHLAEKIAGHYTLAPMATTDTVLFFATGTGEAPHNAMTAELLSRGHTGPIVSAVCVRNQIDLGYLQTHRELERRFPNYHYLVATTRDPINLDPSVSGYVGKMYLQDLVRQGVVER